MKPINIFTYLLFQVSNGCIGYKHGALHRKLIRLSCVLGGALSNVLLLAIFYFLVSFLVLLAIFCFLVSFLVLLAIFYFLVPFLAIICQI